MDLYEGLARGFYQAEARIVTHVPGFGAGDVFRRFCQISTQSLPFSLHEEVACTVAHGAALAGKRSAVLIKSHGLAKAGNSVVDSLMTGVNAGLVVGVFHDREGRHSDSILNSRQLIEGLGLPWLAVDPENPEETVHQAFIRSEACRLPVALLVGDQPAPSETPPPTHEHPSAQPYHRDIAQHVLCPPLARYQKDIYEARRSGISWQSIPPPPLSRCPQDIPFPARRTCEQYLPLFQAFQACRGEIVTGETGLSSLFALPPCDAIDVVTYLGGSLPLGLGFMLAGFQRVWAVTGDFSFLGAGHLSLPEALTRNLPLNVLILYNGQSATTGGERIPEGLMERVLRGYQEFIIPLSHPEKPEHCRTAFRQANDSKTLTLVLADYRNTWVSG